MSMCDIIVYAYIWYIESTKNLGQHESENEAVLNTRHTTATTQTSIHTEFNIRTHT